MDGSGLERSCDSILTYDGHGSSSQAGIYALELGHVDK